MAREIRALDPTRKIIAAMNRAHGEGITEALDVMGFNYHEDLIELFRTKHPDMPIIGTETASAVSTRGEYARDDKRAVVPSYDVDAPYWGKTAQAWWRDDLPVLHLLPHWNWEGREGQPIEVCAYSNLEAVELFLNGASLGRRTPPKDGHAQWTVPYAPGRLVAFGFKGGQVVLKAERRTAGAPARVVLTPHRTRLIADGQDVVVVNVSVCDKAGVIVPKAAEQIDFDLVGPGRLIGLGNGNPNSHEPDKAAFRTTYNGWAQALAQTRKVQGIIRVEARTDGLSGAVAIFPSEHARP